MSIFSLSSENIENKVIFNQSLNMKITRKARGRKSLAELLERIDIQEITELNMTISEITRSLPQGKEVW